jgi:hypothetical protein
MPLITTAGCTLNSLGEEPISEEDDSGSDDGTGGDWSDDGSENFLSTLPETYVSEPLVKVISHFQTKTPRDLMEKFIGSYVDFGVVVGTKTFTTRLFFLTVDEIPGSLIFFTRDHLGAYHPIQQTSNLYYFKNGEGDAATSNFPPFTRNKNLNCGKNGGEIITFFFSSSNRSYMVQLSRDSVLKIAATVVLVHRTPNTSLIMFQKQGRAKRVEWIDEDAQRHAHHTMTTQDPVICTDGYFITNIGIYLRIGELFYQLDLQEDEEITLYSLLPTVSSQEDNELIANSKDGILRTPRRRSGIFSQFAWTSPRRSTRTRPPNRPPDTPP